MIPTLHIVCSLTASLPSVAASYAIPVRQASAFLTASFRFYLTVDTLAVQLPVPLVGPVVAPVKALRAMPGAQ